MAIEFLTGKVGARVTHSLKHELACKIGKTLPQPMYFYAYIIKYEYTLC